VPRLLDTEGRVSAHRVLHRCAIAKLALKCERAEQSGRKQRQRYEGQARKARRLAAALGRQRRFDTKPSSPMPYAAGPISPCSKGTMPSFQRGLRLPELFLSGSHERELVVCKSH
jgi:hypothetical protein